MKLRISFFLLFGFIFTILTCNESINSSSIAPEKVSFVRVNPDTCAIEKGIDAIPEEDAIFLQWIPLDDSNVKSYEIWRSQQNLTNFTKLVDIVKKDSIYTDRQVNVNQKYYYFMLAVNKDNIKGESSDTISYQLLEKAVFLDPSGDINNNNPIFSWEDPNQSAEYILRLYEQQNGQLIWMTLIPSSYSNRETVEYNYDGNAQYESLNASAGYYWRVDVIGSSTYLGVGSESNWTLFNVQ